MKIMLSDLAVLVKLPVCEDQAVKTMLRKLLKFCFLFHARQQVRRFCVVFVRILDKTFGWSFSQINTLHTQNISFGRKPFQNIL